MSITDRILFDQAIQQIEAQYCLLSDETKAEMLNVSKMLKPEKKTILVKEGAYADQLYFILSGGVKAYYLKDGKEIMDWFAFEDDFICAINSYFMNVPSPHYIETLEPSKIMAISRESVGLLCDRFHDFERLGRLGTTRTMLRLQQRVVDLQFETAYKRYQHLLKAYPGVEQRVALGDIASYLGITSETLSRIRSTKA